MQAAVIVFPGSNREGDVARALEQASGRAPKLVWHRDSELPRCDLIVLPGGFAYGDYLRTGAMAAHSPVMAEVKRQAAAGMPVLGVCNGVPVLTKTGWWRRSRDLGECKHQLGADRRAWAVAGGV